MVSYTNTTNNMAYDVESAGREFHDELPVARDSDSDSDSFDGSKSASSLQKFLYGGLAVGAVVLGGAGCYGAYQYLNADEGRPTPTPSTPVVSSPPTPTGTTPSATQAPAPAQLPAQPPAAAHTGVQPPAAPVTPAVTVPGTAHPVHTPVEAPITPATAPLVKGPLQTDFFKNVLREDINDSGDSDSYLDYYHEPPIVEPSVNNTPIHADTMFAQQPVGGAQAKGTPFVMKVDREWNLIDTEFARTNVIGSDVRPIYFQYLDTQGHHLCKKDCDDDLQNHIFLSLPLFDVAAFPLLLNGKTLQVYRGESDDQQFRMAVVREVKRAV